MALRIQNNIAAIEAQRNLGISNTALGKALQRLSSGYRINSAADDAAGLSVSNQLRADIASQQVASRNVSEANSLLQTASGAMNQISNMLTRLKELATQASSANAGANIGKINSEASSLKQEIDRISQSTEYAGTKLLNGTFGVAISAGGATTYDATAGLNGATGLQSHEQYSVAVTAATGGLTGLKITVSATIGTQVVTQTINGVTAATSGQTTDVTFSSLGLTLTLNANTTSATGSKVIQSMQGTASNFQVGAKQSSNDQIGILLGNTTVSSLGLTGLDLSSATSAQSGLTLLDSAISNLNQDMGNIGAIQNRLGYASANLDTTIQNNTAADSVIRDVDMAAEMTNFTKNQILMQAGTAMLAQANSAPQQILALFK